VFPVSEALHDPLQISRRTLLEAAFHISCQAFSQQLGAPFLIIT
jgi:hypothetical protein